MRKTVVLSIAILIFQLAVYAQEYHVATTGNDSNPGTLEAPFLTISAAAKIAYPGDEIIVHAGVYRERITPPRGGVSDLKRISYRAAKNEKVIVKGSEQIVTWVPDGQNVWKVELPNSFFGDYNPYYLKINGPWLYYGQWYHRGSVYYDGKAYSEKQSLEDVLQKKAVGTWYSNIDKDKTTIWAHFPQGNSPNISKLAEINVRETIFFPEISGLKYITVDGFHFMNSAENWASPRDNLQMGAVGTRMGQHWIIENCTISDARCSGISLGKAPGDFDNIDDFGDHIIRNNIIQRCGQAGIIGAHGATRSKITNNLIEEINSRKEFGGFETAGIKFHHSIDTDILGNLIRGVYHESHSAWGIWIDHANQGTRISKNIIYNTDIECLFLEINPGGMLVDHNIFIGSGILTSSGETAFVHNLIVDGVTTYRDDNFRSFNYYKPHTKQFLGKKAGSLKHNKWFNNMFIKQGLDSISKQDGNEVDYNVFLEKAKKSSFDDKHSLVDSSFTSGFTLKEEPLGVTITFNMDQEFLKQKHPLIDGKFIGIFPVTGQTIEDREGNPITVNTDINGRMFTKPIPGPISDLKSGTNIINWTYKKNR